MLTSKEYALRRRPSPGLLEGMNGRADGQQDDWALRPVFVVLVLVTFAGVASTPYFGEAALVAIIVPGILLVFLAPIWGVFAYLVLCGSPYFGIYNYIEPGEIAAAGLLLLLLGREILRSLVRSNPRPIPASFYALIIVFLISAVASSLSDTDPSLWAREQFQYLPVFLSLVVARNLASRRQAHFLVLWSAALTLVALPFEAYQLLLAREVGYRIITNESFVQSASQRLPLPHFSVMNAAALSGLLGCWLLIKKSRPMHILNLALALCIPLLLLLALSRVWTLAASLALLLPSLFAGGKQDSWKRIGKMLLLGLLVGASLYLGFQGLQLLFPELGEALTERVQPMFSPVEDESINIRWEGARYLLSVVAESPIFGHGLGYAVSLAPYRWAVHQQSISAFDNGHMALLIKFGVLGAAVFYWLLYSWGQQAYRVFKRGHDPFVRVTSSTALTGLVVLMVLNFSYSGLNAFENTNFLGVWFGIVFFYAERSSREAASKC